SSIPLLHASRRASATEADALRRCPRVVGLRGGDADVPSSAGVERAAPHATRAARSAATPVPAAAARPVRDGVDAVVARAGDRLVAVAHPLGDVARDVGLTPLPRPRRVGPHGGEVGERAAVDTITEALAVVVDVVARARVVDRVVPRVVALLAAAGG